MIASLLSLPVSSLGTDIGKALVSGLDRLFFNLYSSLEAWLIDQVVALASRSTGDNFTGGYLENSYVRSIEIAAALVLPIFVIAVISALRSASMRGLIELVALRLPLAGLAVAVVPTVVSLLSRFVDAISQASLAGLGSLPTLAHLLGGNLSNPLLGTGAEVVLGLVGLLGAFSLWIELAFRAAALSLVIVLFPIFALSFLLPSALSWAERGVRIIVGLLVAKFVIATGIGLGAAAIAAANHGQSTLESAVTGVALLLVSSLAPVIIFRISAFSELALVEGVTAARDAVTSRLALGARAAAATGVMTPSLGPMPSGPSENDAPWFQGYGPPEASVEIANTDDWMYERIYGKARDEG